MFEKKLTLRRIFASRLGMVILHIFASNINLTMVIMEVLSPDRSLIFSGITKVAAMSPGEPRPASRWAIVGRASCVSEEKTVPRGIIFARLAAGLVMWEVGTETEIVHGDRRGMSTPSVGLVVSSVNSMSFQSCIEHIMNTCFSI